MRVPREWRIFLRKNLLHTLLKIQKQQGHPKILRQDVQDFQDLQDVSCKSCQILKILSHYYSSPTDQKFPERLVHLVKRISTKQDRLVVRRIVDVICCYIDIQRSQLSLVHLLQLAG